MQMCLAPGGDAEEHQAYEMHLLTDVACFRVSFCIYMHGYNYK